MRVKIDDSLVFEITKWLLKKLNLTTLETIINLMFLLLKG
jgi:hypothetical protein